MTNRSSVEFRGLTTSAISAICERSISCCRKRRASHAAPKVLKPATTPCGSCSIAPIRTDLRRLRAMENGGGFLNLDTDLHVTDAVLEAVKQEIRKQVRHRSEPRSGALPRRLGRAALLGVNRDEPGQPFCTKVAGTTVSALYGTERAGVLDGARQSRRGRRRSW